MQTLESVYMRHTRLKHAEEYLKAFGAEIT